MLKARGKQLKKCLTNPPVPFRKPGYYRPSESNGRTAAKVIFLGKIDHRSCALKNDPIQLVSTMSDRLPLMGKELSTSILPVDTIYRRHPPIRYCVGEHEAYLLLSFRIQF